jgi:hypothetical protein
VTFFCQVDLAPTLALLFGIPIPKNNIGVLLPELFHSLTGEYILSISSVLRFHTKEVDVFMPVDSY